jgi:predicted secreted protein
MTGPGARRLAILLVGAALALLQACATSSGSVVRIEADDAARPIELRPGQLLEIRLPSYPGVSQTLRLGSDVAPVLRQEGRPTFHDDTIRGGVSGTGNYETWRFRAMEPGRTQVRMDYRTQWETTGPPSRSVTFDVTVRAPG